MSPSRRELLRAGRRVAAAALLTRAAPAAAQERSDGDLLRGLLGVEQEATLVYGTLRPRPTVPARLFREQSREHARGLGIALRNRGGREPRPPARVGRASPAQALELELQALGAYHRAVGELGDASLLPTLASIMANHGQHAVVLRQALRRDPLPAAFAGARVR